MTKNKQQTTYDVEPIKTLEQLNDMKWSLKKWCGERDYILFLTGINTGLRVGDLLNLKVSDVLKKKVLKIVEQKTGKVREINFIQVGIYEEVQAYAITVQSEWLFPSRQGTNPISTSQAYRQLTKAGDMVDIPSIGTHTMRKTFGYWFYQRTKDIATLQDILNHTHPKVTLKYIGIAQDERNDSLKLFGGL